MNVTIAKKYRPVVEHFFQHHPYEPRITEGDFDLNIAIETTNISTLEIHNIRLHFKYLDFFTWYCTDIDDVVFWERSELFDDLCMDFQSLTNGLDYDLFAPLEARGFLLAGILAGQIHKPIVPVRKHKPFFDRFPGSKVEFINWKNEPEALFVFAREQFRGKKALIVDDIAETGNSLAAAVEALAEIGCSAVGSFFLCDIMKPNVRRNHPFPVLSFIRLT